MSFLPLDPATVGHGHPHMLMEITAIRRFGHSPMLMGIIYGIVHVVGPDHLGTLMTLSTVTSSQNAFRVGAAWGLGHSVGMVTVGVIMIAMHHVIPISVEKWEYYGNYLIGASMILCGLYFIVREGEFLRQNSDGTVVSQGCACHGTVAVQEPARRLQVRWHGRLAQAPQDDLCCQECAADEEDAEREPLIPPESRSGDESCPEKGSDPVESSPFWSERDAKGALLGLFQGTCCPLGMVGMTFMSSLPVHGILGFLVMFLLVSALGTASLAAGWACLTSSGLGRAMNPQLIYRGSCFFTLGLGLLWVVANRFGTLDKLDYTEGMHA